MNVEPMEVFKGEAKARPSSSSREGHSKEAQAVGRRERNAGSQAGEALEMPSSREEAQLQCQGLGWREAGVKVPAASGHRRAKACHGVPGHGVGWQKH